MARTLESTPQLRAIYALTQARKHRHHPTCNCRMYQKVACTAAAALWENKMNIELEALRDP